MLQTARIPPRRRCKPPRNSAAQEPCGGQRRGLHSARVGRRSGRDGRGRARAAGPRAARGAGGTAGAVCGGPTQASRHGVGCAAAWRAPRALGLAFARKLSGWPGRALWHVPRPESGRRWAQLQRICQGRLLASASGSASGSCADCGAAPSLPSFDSLAGLPGAVGVLVHAALSGSPAAKEYAARWVLLIT
jgi:hypothetical protein